MTRAIWKGPFFKPFNLSRIAAAQTKAAAQTTNLSKVDVEMRTTARKCVILPSFVGHTFHVYNGRKFLPVRVSEEMIGHRLGDFAFSKKPAIYRVPK